MSIIPFKMNKFFFMFFVVFFAACHNYKNSNQENKSNGKGRMEQHRKRFRSGHNPVEPNNIFASGDTVFVPANAIVNSKLILHTVKPQEYNIQINTTGVVKPLSGHLAEVTTPFEGRIVKSFIKLGQKVTAGAACEKRQETAIGSTVVFVPRPSVPWWTQPMPPAQAT